MRAQGLGKKGAYAANAESSKWQKISIKVMVTNRLTHKSANAFQEQKPFKEAVTG